MKYIPFLSGVALSLSVFAVGFTPLDWEWYFLVAVAFGAIMANVLWYARGEKDI